MEEPATQQQQQGQEQQQQHQQHEEQELQEQQQEVNSLFSFQQQVDACHEDLQSFLSSLEEPRSHSSYPTEEYHQTSRIPSWTPGPWRQTLLWTGISTQSLLSEETSDASPEKAGWIAFLRDVAPHFLRGDTIKQKQAKLLLIEALDHFDMINDLFLLLRVSLVLWRRGPFKEMLSARFVLLWLICTYVISLTAHACKRYIVYHRIKGKSLRLFVPLAVFGEIKRSGTHCPQALFMFERLTWTFQLLMRLVEDLPQLFMSLVFLINNGKDVYAIAVISYSTTMFVITSVRMGKRYPLKGTLYLLVSSQPPVDDPVAQEAAPTTIEVTLFMSFVFAVWCGANAMGTRYASRIWKPCLGLLSFCFGLLSVTFLSLFVYYKQQRALDVDSEFLRGVSVVSKNKKDELSAFPLRGEDSEEEA